MIVAAIAICKWGVVIFVIGAVLSLLLIGIIPRQTAGNVFMACVAIAVLLGLATLIHEDNING